MKIQKTGQKKQMKSELTKDQLREFYNTEAKKYAETRKKYRKEGKRILSALKEKEKEKIRILEFGCGSGRLLDLLQKEYQGKFEYIGIDLSENLITHAKKEHPKRKFICGDICEIIKTFPQESFDIIIGIASFQHIPTEKERRALMKNFYRVLTYEGKLIMTNRALSKRFIKKHFKQVIISYTKYILTLGQYHARDIFVPRKNKEITHLRYYHLFSVKELAQLLQFSGFSKREIIYIDKNGEYTEKEKQATNSLLIAEKRAISEE